jgi:hypothetical protein
MRVEVQLQEPERRVPVLLDVHSLQVGQQAEEQIGQQVAERAEISKTPTNWGRCKNVEGHMWVQAHTVEHQPR